MVDHFMVENASGFITPTITSGAYAAGDVVGGLIKFDVSQNGKASSFMLRTVHIVDQGNINAAFRIWFFNKEPKGIADNGAFVTGISTLADSTSDLFAMRTYVDIVAADYIPIAGSSTRTRVIKDELSKDIFLNSEYLWAYFVCTGTPTYTSASGLSFNISGWVS